MFKKIIAVAVAAMLSIGVVGVQPALATGCTLVGAGTQASPWLLGSAADLGQVGVGAGCASTQNSNQYYRLTGDIALSGNATPMNLQTTGGQYSADFDGQGFTISGLDISNSASDHQGLFGAISNASVHDLNVTGAAVVGKNFVGALAGLSSSSTVRNVVVAMSGDVSGLQSVGGLVGQASGGAIEDSTFTSAGTVIGTSYCGGAIGTADGTSVNRIGVRSNVTLSNIGGGVIGTYTPNANASLDQLYYSGTMVADQYASGLIGYLWSSTGPWTVEISNSAVRGSVGTVSSYYQPYAFVGQANTGGGPYSSNLSSITFTNSYSTARYRSAASTVAVAGLEGGTTPVASGVFFEPNSGSGLNTSVATSAVAINNSSVVPSGWNAENRVAAAKVSVGTPWVFDTASSNPWNAGRPMPGGLYNLGFFGVVVNQCNAGYYSATGGVPCVPSRPGSYVALPGQTTDLLCPAGSYQGLAGTTSCVLAPAGSYAAIAGALAETLCATGYESNQGAVLCTRIAVVNAPSVTIPTLTAPRIKVAPGQTVTLQGTNVALIKGITVSDKPIEFKASIDSVTFAVPADLGFGEKDLVLKAGSGVVVIQGAIIVIQPASAPISTPTVIFKRVGKQLSVIVTSKTPVSILLGGKVIANNVQGSSARTILTLPKGKSRITVTSAGRTLRDATFLIR